MNRIKTSAPGLASLIEMLVREALDGGQLKGFEPDPSEITLKVRLDPRVPGGWAVDAVGVPMGAVNADDQNAKEREWLDSGDTGVSSEAIFLTMTARRGKYSTQRHEHDNWPKDVSDFGRCFRLLERFPEWRSKLSDVYSYFPGWKPLILAWPELEALYREELGNPKGVAPKLYERIKDLSDACHMAAGWRQDGPGSWHRD